MVACAVSPQRLLAIALLLAAVGACSSIHAGDPLVFVNEARQRVDALHDSNYRFDALFVDFNSDGCPDIFIISHSDWGATSQLWNNRCDGSGTFRHVLVSEAGYYIEGQPLVSGWVTRLDFNGDGRQDFWGRHGSAMGARYRNGSADGSPTPRFAAKEEGCEGYCAFADITGSGNLEVITDNRQVLDMAGRQLRTASGKRALQVVGDITGDGWPDIVQPANGGYWRNDAGTLAWVAVPAFTGDSFMQMLLADFDNDGHLDLFHLDGPQFGSSTRALLYRNDGAGGFVNVTADSGLAGIAASDYGNIIAADFDNDGFQDLMVSGISDSVRIFRNNGDMTFAASTATRFGPSSGDTRGGWQSGKPRADVADFDNDGRLDIVKTRFQDNLGLWRNNTDTGGRRWMKVRVRGGGGNSDGVGASVRWYRAGTNQLVSHMPVLVGEQHPQSHLHTGLAAHQVVDLEVRFPSGGPVYRFPDVASNQEVIVYRNGCMLDGWRPGAGWPLSPPADCSAAQTLKPFHGSVPPPAARAGPGGQTSSHRVRPRPSA